MEIRQFSSCSPRFSKVSQGWARRGARPGQDPARSGGGGWGGEDLCLQEGDGGGPEWGNAEEAGESGSQPPGLRLGELLGSKILGVIEPGGIWEGLWHWVESKNLDSRGNEDSLWGGARSR